jgi:hypothetical protein
MGSGGVKMHRRCIFYLVLCHCDNYFIIRVLPPFLSL